MFVHLFQESLDRPVITVSLLQIHHHPPVGPFRISIAMKGHPIRSRQLDLHTVIRQRNGIITGAGDLLFV